LQRTSQTVSVVAACAVNCLQYPRSARDATLLSMLAEGDIMPTIRLYTNRARSRDVGLRFMGTLGKKRKRGLLVHSECAVNVYLK